MLDSFGLGATEDASNFGDAGANTLGHIAEECAQGRANIDREGVLKLPNLSKLGLMAAAYESAGVWPAGSDSEGRIDGAYGHAKELSSGKDTSSGHWELAGVPVMFDWGYFTDKQNSFPAELLDSLIHAAGLDGVLGNCHASGTTIINELGAQHMQTGMPIIYTSADSVFQIACHEETYGLEALYSLCEQAYELLKPYNICRVIARPFVGDAEAGFKRTGNRRDYSVPPPAETVLDKLCQAGGQVYGVGKISDIYATQGISHKIKASGLEELFDATLSTLKSAQDRSVVFTNFVDFDSEYGHRRDVAGYARALEYFDARLPELLDQLGEGDVVILTADHGCDPTWPGSDHTREHVPVLVYGKNIEPGSLGRRETFADIGQSIATYLDLPATEYGTSFLN